MRCCCSACKLPESLLGRSGPARHGQSTTRACTGARRSAEPFAGTVTLQPSGRLAALAPHGVSSRPAERFRRHRADACRSAALATVEIRILLSKMLNPPNFKSSVCSAAATDNARFVPRRGRPTLQRPCSDATLRRSSEMPAGRRIRCPKSSTRLDGAAGAVGVSRFPPSPQSGTPRPRGLRANSMSLGPIGGTGQTWFRGAHRGTAAQRHAREDIRRSCSTRGNVFFTSRSSREW